MVADQGVMTDMWTTLFDHRDEPATIILLCVILLQEAWHCYRRLISLPFFLPRVLKNE